MRAPLTALAGVVFAAAVAFAAAPAVLALSAMPPADFGAPPSGEVPILFNDHHVYTKPDRLKAQRVLAALVRGTTILIPLRSMFEQMGATVSYDAATKVVDVSKPGSDVKVTVGKPEVIINGESRPLDVPPEIYQGVVVVPVRVISEGMGAYVQWVSDKHLVVVRYIPATPPPPPPPPTPTAAPTEAPAPPPPTPSPTPTPKPPYFDKYIAGDYVLSPKVYNELAPGVQGKDSFDVKAAIEFPAFNTQTLMLGGEFRQFQYQHNSNFPDTVCTNPGSPGCQTVVGNGGYREGTCPNASDPGCVTVPGYTQYSNQLLLGQAYVPAFTAQERDIDGRLGLRIADPKIYLAISFYGRNYNYLGYPNLRGLGFGIEKLPDLDQAFSLYGSAYLYPGIKSTYVGPTSPYLGSLSGESFTMQYNVIRYEVGATITLGHSPFFLEGGFLGDRGDAHADAPANFTHSGGFVGAGLHL